MIVFNIIRNLLIYPATSYIANLFLHYPYVQRDKGYGQLKLFVSLFWLSSLFFDSYQLPPQIEYLSQDFSLVGIRDSIS